MKFINFYSTILILNIKSLNKTKIIQYIYHLKNDLLYQSILGYLQIDIKIIF